MELDENQSLTTRPRRTRVLFVPQWYPVDDPEGTAGAFSREHVHAAALYDDVAVLYYTARRGRWPTLRWERIEDEGVPTFYATYGRSPLPKTTRPVFYVNLWRAIRRAVLEWGRPDVIHTQDGHAYYVMKAAARLNVPTVISQHSGSFLRRDLQPYEVKRYKRAFSGATKILAANKFAAKDYASYGIDAKFAWLPNTLNPDIFYPANETAKENALVHVSALTPVKRFPDIITAFAHVQQKRPNAVLHIVGGRECRASMQELANYCLPRGSFRFHGYLPKPDIAQLMRRARGFVLASENETFSCVLMEAMACGCPVLTTRVGGIPAVVGEEDGLFFDVGHVDAMVNGMMRLIDGTHGLDMRRISSKARARFAYESVGLILHKEHVAAAGAKN